MSQIADVSRQTFIICQFVSRERHEIECIYFLVVGRLARVRLDVSPTTINGAFLELARVTGHPEVIFETFPTSV